MITPKITLKAGKSMFVPPALTKDWIVCVPTLKHRLHREGTCGLKWDKMYDLKSKKGILYVDVTKKKVFIFLKEDLMENIVKKGNIDGVKNAITVFNCKKLYEEGKFESYETDPGEYRNELQEEIMAKLSKGYRPEERK
jgi:hypothetical protein